MIDDKNVLRALLRQDLSVFIEKTFRTVVQGEPFFRNWHIDAIAHHLSLVYQGGIKRLIITIPPRSLKSISASVAFPAWILGQNPTSRIVCVSYASDLAAKHAMDCRTVMQSQWYRDVFPGTRIHAGKNAVSEFTTTKNGYRLSTSIGGTLTGRGGNLIIIDDPHKAEEASSDVKRNTTLDWYRRTLVSRLDNKLQGRIIVIQQRLHEDDLAGHLLEAGGWTHLNLRAIAEDDESIPIGEGHYHLRHEGEVLNSMLEPIEALEQIKSEIGSYHFAAQYQQRPAPLEGGIIKWEWFRHFIMKERDKPGDITVQSWDTACSTTDTSDYTVCTTWLIRDNWYCLIDVFRQRVDPLNLRNQILLQAQKHKPTVTLIEKMNASVPLILELRKNTPLNILAVTPKGDKQTRMMAEIAAIESQRVLVPQEAPWLADFHDEMVMFPNSKYFDQIDSVSQFLFWARNRSYGPPKVRVTTFGFGPRLSTRDILNMRLQ